MSESQKCTWEAQSCRITWKFRAITSGTKTAPNRKYIHLQAEYALSYSPEKAHPKTFTYFLRNFSHMMQAKEREE